MTTLRFLGLGLGALVASLSCAACGGDVELTPAPANTGTTSSADTCTISPGEDLCSRRFDLPDADRENVVAFLQLVSSFAGIAQRIADTTFTQCDAIGAEVDVHGVGLPEDPPLKKKTSGCLAIGKALAAMQPNPFTVQLLKPAACYGGTPLPACASTPTLTAGKQISEHACTGPIVNVTLTSSADGDARAPVFLASLQRHLRELLAGRQSLEDLTELTAAISSASSFGTDIPAPCAAKAATMLATANDQIQAVITSLASISETLPLQ